MNIFSFFFISFLCFIPLNFFYLIFDVFHGKYYLIFMSLFQICDKKFLNTIWKTHWTKLCPTKRNIHLSSSPMSMISLSPTETSCQWPLLFIFLKVLRPSELRSESPIQIYSQQTKRSTTDLQNISHKQISKDCKLCDQL